MAAYRAHKKRGVASPTPVTRRFTRPAFPLAGDYQSKLTLMSESLRNDGRVWVPRDPEDATKPPSKIDPADRYYYLEERYPAFGNLVPRDVASRNAMYVCDDGLGVGNALDEDGKRRGVYLDFADAIRRLGRKAIEERYGNLFEMYERITGDDPYETPMIIYPATHYTMGGLWVDYNLMSNIAGLFVGGEANFSDHGANRLGASALMQGLADGYFVLPFTIGNYLGEVRELSPLTRERIEFKLKNDNKFSQQDADEALATIERLTEEHQTSIEERIEALMNAPSPTHPPDYYHRRLGLLMYKYCGMSRNEEGLKKALKLIPDLRDEFLREVKVTGSADDLNPTLERALRIYDFFELAELMCIDALTRQESCGGHFRTEFVSDDGAEAKRDDENFQHVSAWEYTGDSATPTEHREALEFEYVKPTTRSYK